MYHPLTDKNPDKCLLQQKTSETSDVCQGQWRAIVLLVFQTFSPQMHSVVTQVLSSIIKLTEHARFTQSRARNDYP